MKTNAVIVGLVLGVAGLVSGCTPVIQSGLPDPQLSARDKQMMALAEPDEWTIPNRRSIVQYQTPEKPGTIIVDTTNNYLYYILPHGQAVQYRIASGAEYMGWTGRAEVGAMKEWPTWMPTASIMERWPQFQVYKQHGPLEGRWDNPLGARALYLFQINVTRSSASTAPTSRRKSAGMSPRAASACATWTRSTSMVGCASARLWWSSASLHRNGGSSKLLSFRE